MNVAEIRKLEKEEITSQINEIKQQINKSRVELKSQKVTPENINSYRTNKKLLAKYLTVLHEKEILDTIKK